MFADKGRFETMRTPKKSALIMGGLLAIIGIMLIGSTVHQELIEENIEPHMTPITRRGKWLSTNPIITFIGAILLLIGIPIILFTLLA